jgi:hypothetical protein
MEERKLRNWNIFARELSRLLEIRGHTLGALHTKSHIHSQKVQRLRDSLANPKSFPTLNPDEMRQVQTDFAFTDLEMNCLLAAILATAVEATLMDRVNQVVAHAAAEQIFVILFTESQRETFAPILAMLEAGGIMAQDINAILAPILIMLEKAQLAFHLSMAAVSGEEQYASALQAQHDFTLVLDAMDKLPTDVIQTEEWRYWQQEALSGQLMVNKRIVQLGS